MVRGLIVVYRQQRFCINTARDYYKEIKLIVEINTANVLQKIIPTGLAPHPASIDHNDRSVQVAGSLGSKENNGSAKIAGLAPSPGGNAS